MPSPSPSPSAPAPVLQLLTRPTCGSCERVAQQIRPVVASFGFELSIVDITQPPASTEYGIEFGDRVPVLLIDEEEFAAWEVDNDELAAHLTQYEPSA